MTRPVVTINVNARISRNVTSPLLISRDEMTLQLARLMPMRTLSMVSYPSFPELGCIVCMSTMFVMSVASLNGSLLVVLTK